MSKVTPMEIRLKIQNILSLDIFEFSRPNGQTSLLIFGGKIQIFSNSTPKWPNCNFIGVDFNASFFNCNSVENQLKQKLKIVIWDEKFWVMVFTVQRCGFSPVCRRRWTTSMYWALNGFSSRAQFFHWQMKLFLLELTCSLFKC